MPSSAEARKQRMEKEFDFRVLQHGVSSGRLKIFTDFRVFNQGHSPTYSPWDNVAPLLFMVLVSLALLVLVGIIVGVLALVLSVVLYAFLIRIWVMHRLHERTRQAMMQNLNNCVITSYSIHYTKLYDLCQRGRSSPRLRQSP